MINCKALVALTFLICTSSAPVIAEVGYPTKAIRIIVPFTPGGSPDVLA